MTNSVSYLRGAFIAFDPAGGLATKWMIPFRFNPEGLNRQLAIQQAAGAAAAAPATGTAAAPASGGATPPASDASGGSLKESFSVMVRLDFVDREEGQAGLRPELGIAPEIAALEELMYPIESEAAAASTGQQAVSANPPRPTVLFIWGPKRVVPVTVTGMTINEIEHNALLYPVRAEVEVSLEVVSQADQLNSGAVKQALQYMQGVRRRLARTYLDTTAAQAAGTILPF